MMVFPLLLCFLRLGTDYWEYFTILCLFSISVFVFVIEAAYATSDDVELIRETSNSTLSREHQQQPFSIASRIPSLTSLFDSQDLDCNDDGMFENNSVLKLGWKGKFPNSRVTQPS